MILNKGEPPKNKKADHNCDRPQYMLTLVRDEFSIKESAFLLTLGAENEARTRDPNLGKVVLYQLSYFRII